MKKCTDCNRSFTESNFNGRSSKCRPCDNTRRLIKGRTKQGIVTKSYGKQKQKSIERSHPSPLYSNKELLEWALSQPVFHSIYDKWVLSGYDKWKKPSFDRINDYIGYSLDNIRVVTWEENFNNYSRDKKNGRNNKQNRAIIQYDKSGNFIKEFYSAAQAERETGANYTHIVSVCAGKKARKSAGGFLWRYKD